MPLDLRPFLDRVEALVERHAAGRPGGFSRWSRPDAARRSGADVEGPDPYGCADAANLLYTLGRWPRDPDERRAFSELLQSFQEAETGLFREASHHPFHTTAHCAAALELFDARPRHPLAAMAPHAGPDGAAAFLEQLDWSGAPWTESHRGAGLHAALVLAGEAPEVFEERVFAWLWDAADPDTGLWRRGCLPPREHRKELFPHLAGTFHYLFNHEHARRPLRYPEALVDTCLAIWRERLFPLCTFVGFAEIDWVYCLHRALRQSGHRHREAREALRELAAAHLAFLEGLDPEADDALDDLHRLFGTVCALAELQQALPGELRSARPLRLVLDRRPFI